MGFINFLVARKAWQCDFWIRLRCLHLDQRLLRLFFSLKIQTQKQKNQQIEEQHKPNN